LGYEFDIIYKIEASNKVIDSLSGMFEDVMEKEKELQMIITPFLQYFQSITKEVQKDVVL